MNFLKIFCDSFVDNWDSAAVTDLDTGLTLTYGSLAARIERIKLIFDSLGIPDTAGVTHVGIVADNSIDWITAYMATIQQRHVAVVAPVTDKIEESLYFMSTGEVEILFIDKKYIDSGIEWTGLPNLKLVLTTDTQEVVACMTHEYGDVQSILNNIDFNFMNLFPQGFLPSDVHAPDIAPDTPLSIFFTSATIGMPKPVVLTSDNLEGNAIFGIKARLYPRGASTVVTCPLGNVWGCMFCLLVPLISGAHIKIFKDYYNPNKLIKSFKKAQPLRVLLNPGQARSLYAHSKQEFFKSRRYKFIKNLPLHKKLVNMGIRNLFNKTTGGNCREVVVGSSNIGRGLMNLLKDAGIKFTVSYGMVESGGIIACSPASEFEPGTVGRPINNIIKYRLRPIDLPGLPDDTGILEVSGMTVMKEYYNDPELTQEAFTADGWLQTRDLATINERGEITIVARLDTIISRNGSTVVPERIEAALIDTSFINQVVVIERAGLLIAIVYPDIATIKAEHGTKVDIDRFMEKIRLEVNDILPRDYGIDKIEISPEPLEANLKGTVSRFFYF